MKHYTNKISSSFKSISFSKSYWLLISAVAILSITMSGCATSKISSTPDNSSAAKENQDIYPGKPVERQGDEIVAAGHFFHTGAPVILWTDSNGYDAYRQARWFTHRDNKEAEYKPSDKNGLYYLPNHYGIRDVYSWTKKQLHKLRRGNWTLKQLQEVVNKVVVHYDACGTSEFCFRVLQHRGLSSHFLLDLDGTIYQTLDLKERSWTAGAANDHAINIEIANIGAYSQSNDRLLKMWYKQNDDGTTDITIPKGFGHVLHPDKAKHPARSEPIIGKINGGTYKQYDFTLAQYRSLIKLTAALHRIFPKIEIKYPHKKNSAQVLETAFSKKELEAFHGIIGHQHVIKTKSDPGPAFQWEWFISQVKKTLEQTKPAAIDN